MNSASSAKGHGPLSDFQVIFNSLQGNYLLLKPDPPFFTILAVSDEQLQITKQERQEVVGKSVFEVYPENPGSNTSTGPSNLNISLQNVLDNHFLDQMPVLRYDVARADGVFEERYWRISNKPVFDLEGNILYILHTSSEVTAQVMSDRKAAVLREIEKKYSLFMQAPVAFCIVKGPENIVELANQELLQVLGGIPDMSGKPFLDSIPEAKEQGLSELLDRVRATGDSYNGKEYPITLKMNDKQEVRYYNFVLQPYYQDNINQEAIGVFSVWHDVTAQVLARREVEESELQVRSFIESSHHPIGVYFGREMRIQFANQALKDGLGKGNDIVGKLYRDVLPELENQQIFEQLDKVYTTGIPFKAKNLELDLVVGGELRKHYFDLSLTPLFNTAGEVYGIINTGADVTELNLARERVAVSEDRYRSLIEEAPVATALYIGNDIRIQYANEIMLSYWGKGPSVIGKTFREALPEFKDQKFPDLLENVYESGQPYSGREEMAELLVDGQLQQFYFNFTYKPLFNEDGQVYGIHHTAIDVTEMVHASKKVEKSARELQNLANAMPQLVWIAEPDGRVTYYNNRVADFSGAHQLPDGTWIWESMLLEEDTQPTIKAWSQSVVNGTLYEIEHRVKMNDGSYRWHLSRALPQRNIAGKVIKWFGTATDVHERKQHQEDLEVSNSHLKRTNNDLDNFIYTASHDLKAPISNIEGLLGILADDFAADALPNEGTKDLLVMMKNSVDRFKRTIDSLTDVAKLQQENELDTELVDVAEVIEEVTMDLAPMIAASQAVLDVDVTDCPFIRFSTKNLRSVIYNLLSNAVKYSSPQRMPRVRISCHKTDQFYVLTVADNGLGLEPGHKAALFTMFKRFHDHVEGTGIGLYMVKKMVDNVGGEIKVESDENIGTKFMIYFPA